VHDYGEDDGGGGGRRTAWLVMELVRGEPLSTLISRGPIDTEETLRIIEEAAWALQAAHERGFVHRDVKPGNILVRTDGLVKLTDFGIAKAADAVPVTRSGMVMGTAHYIAPEQASGAEAGPSGDVYSLGIVGYECLAGHRPFRAENAVAVAMMQVRDEPPPLPDTVPVHARELIECVLVKDPTLRYATGGEFAAAVAAVRRGEPLPAPGSMVGPYTPTRARPAVGMTTPPPTPAVTPDRAPGPTRGSTRKVRAEASRSATPSRPVAAPTEALRLSPTRGRGRTTLLVLFVLLTLAAVVVGVFVLRSLGGSQGQQSGTPLGAAWMLGPASGPSAWMLGPASGPSAAGTVASRAAGTALGSLIDIGGVR
jgi:eukaryotic-like serine/threonine-protein kinase